MFTSDGAKRISVTFSAPQILTVIQLCSWTTSSALKVEIVGRNLRLGQKRLDRISASETLAVDV